MKQQLLACLLAMPSFIPAVAAPDGTPEVRGAHACYNAPREVQRGYRGMVEWSTDITSYKFDLGSRSTSWSTGVVISSGYQFNPRFYLGAGIGLQPEVNSYGADLLPVFAHVRTDQTFGRFTPYGDLRLGYNCCDGGGIYFSPSVGYRFNWGRRVNLNLGVGLTLRGSTTQNYDVTVTEFPDGSFSAVINDAGRTHHVKPMFSIRLGLDF